LIQSTPLVADGDAIAVFEIASIARGVVVLDQMAKRAFTEIISSKTVSPGKYLIILSGTVAEIEEASFAALESMQDDQIDHIILRDPHPLLRKTFANELEPNFRESISICEFLTLSSTIHALDVILKSSGVEVIELRLGAGLDGKGIFTVTGSLDTIEAACDLIESNVDHTKIHRIEKIAQIHEDLPKHLLGAELPASRGTPSK